MCLMTSVECVVVGVCIENDISTQSLNSGIRIIAILYSGIVCSALALCIMTRSIRRKGALFVSMFVPLMLMITAILSWAHLCEKVNLGKCLGSILIIEGIYVVLWGNRKEAKQRSNVNEDEIEPDLELQADAPSDGGHHVHAQV
ncbi:WAT1-related protein At1g09380-like [Punica granatum]|nr:WAT1-related protein At1g09380-like [Punica granatum]XP_031406539.1 WAT1-related protein At1g09380-like [Punica granatum]